MVTETTSTHALSASPEGKLKVAKAPAGHELPDYIVERNRRALSAGLRIEKQAVKDHLLTTVYTGLPEAFLNSGLIRDRDKFLKSAAATTKRFDFLHCMRILFSPFDQFCRGRMHRTDGRELRATVTREPFPSRIWTHAAGVTAYQFVGVRRKYSCGPCISYVCDRPEPLIDLGIAPAKAFELNDDNVARKSECSRIPGEEKSLPLWGVFSQKHWGRFVLQHFPGNAERAESEQEKEREEVTDAATMEYIEQNFRDPVKFRALLLWQTNWLDVMLRYASGDKERDTTGEASIWLRADTLQRLMELRGTIVALIENAEIMTKPVHAEAPKLRLVKNNQEGGTAH